MSDAALTSDYSVEIAHLTTLVAWRTAYYQIAWSLSVAAIPLFVTRFPPFAGGLLVDKALYGRVSIGALFVSCSSG